jgi:hypothetical protein
VVGHSKYVCRIPDFLLTSKPWMTLPDDLFSSQLRIMSIYPQIHSQKHSFGMITRSAVESVIQDVVTANSITLIGWPSTNHCTLNSWNSKILTNKNSGFISSGTADRAPVQVILLPPATHNSVINSCNTPHGGYSPFCQRELVASPQFLSEPLVFLQAVVVSRWCGRTLFGVPAPSLLRDFVTRTQLDYIKCS